MVALSTKSNFDYRQCWDSNPDKSEVCDGVFVRERVHARVCVSARINVVATEVVNVNGVRWRIGFATHIMEVAQSPSRDANKVHLSN